MKIESEKFSLHRNFLLLFHCFSASLEWEKSLRHTTMKYTKVFNSILGTFEIVVQSRNFFVAPKSFRYEKLSQALGTFDNSVTSSVCHMSYLQINFHITRSRVLANFNEQNLKKFMRNSRNRV